MLAVVNVESENPQWKDDKPGIMERISDLFKRGRNMGKLNF